MSADRSGPLGPIVALAALAALLWLERRRPLRKPVEPGVRRVARNFALGGVTSAVLAVAERPLIRPLAREIEARRWGLVQALPLPAAVRTALALALMDYTLYVWHVLLHRSPALWRLHEPHHADLDLDASTAARFHFLEVVASIPWRAVQIVLIGAGPRVLALWQRLTLIEVFFHHSNVRLRSERDSNFSSGLTLWDHLHGTVRTNVPQQRITIGLPNHRTPEPLTRVLSMPFARGPQNAQASGEGPVANSSSATTSLP
jgi:sterol desaturase/sphingolipid hydroxylase (fatty acid hydroxylase superfamily)